MMTTRHTADDLKLIVQAMKRAHLGRAPADASLRRDRLDRAARLILDNHAEITGALAADYGTRSLYQSMAADVAVPVAGLRHAAEHVADWMRAETVAAPEAGMATSIVPQPLGVVGIISPWNFPINLSFGPLAGVFAAGNTALLKPSELTPRTSDVLAELIARYFDPMELGVVLGDAGIGAAFAGLPFDHLVFTGSTAVGRQVMRAAADNLVPVTLELGGKSPVMVEDDADLGIAAERTLTVKTFNAGQICVAPDYVLLPAGAVDGFVAASRDLVARSYPRLQANPDYTAILTRRHFARLLDLLADAEAKGATLVSLASAGEPAADPVTRKLAPTLVLNPTAEMRVLQEEIFGPVLPVVPYSDRDAAIAAINAGPRPLAAYHFGVDPARRQDFAARTVSGALVFDDVMSQSSIETLPFGGVGASGMGAYHGVHGFRRFSHFKPVVVQSPSGTSNLRLRAPYAEKLPVLRAALGL